MDHNGLHSSSDWEAFFSDFDARLPSEAMRSGVVNVSPDLSATSSFDSPIENATNEELEVAPNSSMPYLSFNTDEVPSGPPFYPFTIGPPGFVHMQMDPTATLTFQSNIWFPPSEFIDSITIVDNQKDSTEVPLSAPPAEVTPPPTQTIHHPASQVTHILNTYFQFPPKNDLWMILQTIVTSDWYQTNIHEPFYGLKRSIFLNFLAHRPRDPIYRCLFDNCNEFFPRQDRALGHIRKHFDYRPFVCTGPCAATGCEERFYCQSYLKTHLTRQKISCSACSTRLYPQNMNRHLKTCHKSRIMNANTNASTDTSTSTSRQLTKYTRSRIRRL